MYNKICFCITNEQHFSIFVPPSDSISDRMSSSQVLSLVSIVRDVTLFLSLYEEICHTHLHDKFLTVVLWERLAATVSSFDCVQLAQIYMITVSRDAECTYQSCCILWTELVFPRDFGMCAYFILFPAVVIRDSGTITIRWGVAAFKDCTFKVMQNSEMVSVFILNTIA